MYDKASRCSPQVGCEHSEIEVKEVKNYKGKGLDRMEVCRSTLWTSAAMNPHTWNISIKLGGSFFKVVYLRLDFKTQYMFINRSHASQV